MDTKKLKKQINRNNEIIDDMIENLRDRDDSDSEQVKNKIENLEKQKKLNSKKLKTIERMEEGDDEKRNHKTGIKLIDDIRDDIQRFKDMISTIKKLFGMPDKLTKQALQSIKDIEDSSGIQSNNESDKEENNKKGINDRPNPDDYPKGSKDPQYTSDYNAWYYDNERNECVRFTSSFLENFKFPY